MSYHLFYSDLENYNNRDLKTMRKYFSLSGDSREEMLDELATFQSRRYSEFPPGSQLAGSDFTNRDFSGESFVDANLQNASFQSANLRDANLTGANLTKANLSRANLTNAKLTLAKLTIADLRGANLSSANLRGANLFNAELAGANLTDANLIRAVLADADLTGANLINANLINANLFDAKLINVDLTNAYLFGANLTSVYLNNANLNGADLTKANLSRANLSRENLTNAKLSNADLRSADLRMANLSGANLSNANLANAFMIHTLLLTANLSNADLSSVYLNNANLTNANLSSANLSGTDLSGTDLTNANLNNANLTNADLTNANLANAKLINANLYGANFTGATNTDFTGANFMETIEMEEDPLPDDTPDDSPEPESVGLPAFVETIEMEEDSQVEDSPERGPEPESVELPAFVKDFITQSFMEEFEQMFSAEANKFHQDAFQQTPNKNIYLFYQLLLKSKGKNEQVYNWAYEQVPYKTKGQAMAARSKEISPTMAMKLSQVLPAMLPKTGGKDESDSDDECNVPAIDKDCDNDRDLITRECWSEKNPAGVKIKFVSPNNFEKFTTQCYSRKKWIEWLSKEEPVAAWYPNKDRQKKGEYFESEGYGGSPSLTEFFYKLPPRVYVMNQHYDMRNFSGNYIAYPFYTNKRIGNTQGTFGVSQLHGQEPGETIYFIVPNVSIEQQKIWVRRQIEMINFSKQHLVSVPFSASIEEMIIKYLAPKTDIPIIDQNISECRAMQYIIDALEQTNVSTIIVDIKKKQITSPYIKYDMSKYLDDRELYVDSSKYFTTNKLNSDSTAFLPAGNLPQEIKDIIYADEDWLGILQDVYGTANVLFSDKEGPIDDDEDEDEDEDDEESPIWGTPQFSGTSVPRNLGAWMDG